MQEIAECKSVHIVCVPEVFAVADYIFVHRILVKTGERAGSESKISVFLVGCAQYLERKCRSPPYADAGSLKRAE